MKNAQFIRSLRQYSALAKRTGRDFGAQVDVLVYARQNALTDAEREAGMDELKVLRIAETEYPAHLRSFPPIS